MALLTPDDVEYYGSRERLRGYYEAFGEAGVEWSGVTTINTAVNSKEAGTTAAAYLLDQADPPTAVVASSDILALGALHAHRPHRWAARLRCPTRMTDSSGVHGDPIAAGCDMRGWWGESRRHASRAAQPPRPPLA